MDTEKSIVTDEDLEELSIFPLPKVVFFPGTYLPLHIFEARYREMIAEAIDFERPIAMPMQVSPDLVDAEGRPSITTVAGVGMIRSYELLPDGRFLITLRGVARIEILEEHPPNRAFRRVRARLMEDRTDAPETTEEQVRAIQNLVFSMQPWEPRISTSLMNKLTTIGDPAHTANVLCDILFEDPRRRQELLEESCVDIRLEAVVSRLSEILLEASTRAHGKVTLN